MQIQDVIRYVFDQHFKDLLGRPGGLATLDDAGKLHRAMVPSLDDVYPPLVVSRTFSGTAVWDLSDVPLEEAVYQLHINAASDTVDTGDIWLLPNGAAYAASFTHSTLYWTSVNKAAASFKRVDKTNAFCIGTTDTAHALILISTYRNNKRLVALSAAARDQSMNIIASWNNSSTPWTTLGTILFPQPTSGIVGLRRLV